MSASVLGCGHSHHLMDINCFETCPQVHLHFLTDDEEVKLSGHAKVELCCHGCGESLLVYYDYDKDTVRHRAVRDEFKARHKLCPDRGYAAKCPDYRSKLETIDLRTKRKTKRSERGDKAVRP